MIGHFLAVSIFLAAADSVGTAVPDTVVGNLPERPSAVLPDTVNTGWSDIPAADSVLITDFQPISAEYKTIDDPRVDRLLAEADSLRRIYEFAEAVGRCRQAMEYTADSLKMLEIEDCQIFCENGANLRQYAYSPSVVSRKRLALDDFYLYYPLEDKGWHPVAGQGVSDGYGGFPYVAYSCEDSLRLTAADMEKVYSVVSADGKSMYFSSASLYGMGGYDLYVSRRDGPDSEWGTPVNLGLPFSSPYDDFLYVDTEDGKYTLFASNRGCPADSINVYVLEYDSMPVRSAMEDVGRLRELMELNPCMKMAVEEEEDSADAIPENADTERYAGKMAEVRALKDSIYLYNKALDEARELFAMSDDVDERIRLTNEILRKESWLPRLEEALGKAASELQSIEMEFLFKGILIDPDKMAPSLELHEDEGVEADEYRFVKKSPGDTLYLVKGEDEFDYTFQILPEGRFAPDNTLPDGVVYQIQVFNVGRKATVSQLKGLSPVFEKVSASRRYNYSVGVFTSYRDATEALSRVKRLGFKNAYIVAYRDGNPIAVSKARELQ